MLRNIFAVIAGVLVGLLIILLVEKVGHTVYPVPADIDLNNEVQVKALLDSLPVGAKVFIVLAYIFGAFGAGLTASWISKDINGPKLALFPGALLELAAIFNFISIPHPVWMIVIALLFILPFAWFGGKVAQRQRRAGRASAEKNP